MLMAFLEVNGDENDASSEKHARVGPESQGPTYDSFFPPLICGHRSESRHRSFGAHS